MCINAIVRLQVKIVKTIAADELYSKKRMKLGNPVVRAVRVAVVGGGPAGSSLAIRLANAGYEVELFERERFPRQKLCGEFISPECLKHFQHLGVIDEMLDLGGQRIGETRFYSMSGRSAAVPSKWLGSGGLALSLSRAEMDRSLLERARECGVNIYEATSVVGLKREASRLVGLTIRDDRGTVRDVLADLFVDATGRSAILSKLLHRNNPKPKAKSDRPSIIGFKAHLRNAEIRHDRCEIYSFPGGYGGLSPIENGLANHCFMIKAECVRELGGSVDRILNELIFQNKRARQTLERADPATQWLSVAIAEFGERGTAIAGNAFSVGDSAAFIDPFTGSGMLMAFESSEILADCIIGAGNETTDVETAYKLQHAKRFRRRLAVCRLIRQAAFVPMIGNVAVSAMSISKIVRRTIARSTRQAEQT